MTTRIALHRFVSDRNAPQRDGVNLAHTEINALLQLPEANGFDFQFHDFDRALRDDDYARACLSDVDCVLCNVGPNAHYYHHLRERLQLNFRIVRDVKTALWSCYLLQETLCAPYLRSGDALLATSNYLRVMLRRIFPHLSQHPIALFEPVLVRAAGIAPPPPRAPACAVLTLGYIGRLSDDKNFPQMIDLLIELNRREPSRYRLIACGAVHSPSCDPHILAQRVQRETGRSDLFCYLPPRSHEDALSLYTEFDYFLFFSTSNLEVLGRVLLEAAQAGVPILSASHAAAPELLNGSSLIPVEYKGEAEYFCHFDQPLGKVDLNAAIDILQRREIPGRPPVAQVNLPQSLFALLTGEDHGLLPDPPLHATPAQLIERLRIADLPCYSSRTEVDQIVAELRSWFCALNGHEQRDWQTDVQTLKQRSRFPARTARFIEASSRARCDFTNLGGLDMELCNIAGFYPRFWLAPSESRAANTSSSLGMLELEAKPASAG